MKYITPLRYISYIAIAIYFGFGFYLLVKPGVLEGYSPGIQKVLGAALILYGAFRVWILVQRIKFEKKHRQQNEE